MINPEERSILPRMPSRALVAAALFVIAGCATTSNDATAEASDSAASLSRAEVYKDPDRMICRREKPTGSRISEKICMTAREWQQISDDGQRQLDKLQRAPQQQSDQ